MPSNYKRKTNTRYTAETLEGEKMAKVSKETGIPRKTLYTWMKAPPSKYGRGRPTVLTSEEEKNIVDAMHYAAQFGFPLKRMDLKTMVQ